VLGVLDYCWAPADNKLSPRCQKPEGWGDFLLAVIGFPIKIFFVVVVIEPVMASIADDAVSFVYHLFLLGCAGAFMSTLCLPVTLWYSPTLKEVRQQYTQEKKEINASKKDYVKANFFKFAKCMFFAPCKLFIPWVFVATGKSLAVVVFAEILFGMSAWCYVLFRVALSACTYKLLTVKGWIQEIKDCIEIKKRVMALDYPCFNPDSQGQHDGDATGVAAKAARAGKDAGVAGATDKASQMAIVGWCPFWSLITISFSVFCDLFAEFVFSFLLQFVVAGFAIFIAEKTLQARKENKESTGKSSAKEPEEPSTPMKSGGNDDCV
jgi:large-conductance mechanosensitive channel